jgi:hypothetical protein
MWHDAAMASATTIIDFDVDETNFFILAFVEEHRDQTGTGPLWREVREHLGWPSIDGRMWWHVTHRDVEARREFHEAWKLWRAEHQDLPKKGAHRQYHRDAFEEWRLAHDELRIRLERLRELGLVLFDTTPRSLDVTDAGLQVLAAQGETQTVIVDASTSKTVSATDAVLGLAQLHPGGPHHVVRRMPSGRWMLACRSTRSVPTDMVMSMSSSPDVTMCQQQGCQRALRP